ncbi:rRNA maturation RNase YbeY [Bacillus horti]|uniref:Endoribonuclease YbeY n=1 Tax=Caldalkalibacillus horti TaxID=77523 RepID=A0ABT9W480_9BACI|nr:rRNA maturation RNase YbeY [Bacillus horti]MDQ0168052.1 putative rRNA maturation factor [Bacillus horti]
MSVSVLFTDENQYGSAELEELLVALIDTAARLEDVQDGEVSISFVNDQEIQEINKTYRMKDQPTDVLSFPMYEADEEEIEVTDLDEPLLLGDIVISIPRAKDQAEEYGHSFERELGFLTIHGFLHLLGYDHGTEQEEKEMFDRQEEILKQHGLIR